MFSANLCCYLWDLADEGIDTVLDRARGEAGVTGIEVPLCCGPVEQLRVHEVEPRVFRSPGGVQFQPAPASYSATRIRPAAAAWLKKANPLATVIEACVKRGLSLTAAIECCHNPALVERFPAAACKDALGQPRRDWLCPSNPDVREYLRSLVEDIANHYAVSAVTLQSVFYPTPPAPGTCSLELGDVGQWLASLCFCESCLQAGTRDGVDARSARQSARHAVEKILASGEPAAGTMDAYLKRDAALRDYIAWQEWQLKSLTEMIRSICDHPLLAHTNVKGVADTLDGVVAVSTADMEAVERALRAGMQAADDPRRVNLCIRAEWRACPDSAALVRAVSRAVALGASGATIWHYGLLPLERLDWVRQAVRKAQRDSL